MADLQSSIEPGEYRGSQEGNAAKGYVYIMTNCQKGVLYIGATTDIVKRTFEHRHKLLKGFTSRYNLDKLVYIEEFEAADEAFRREKQLKKYPRQYKINLIQLKNPYWRDLYNEIVDKFEEHK